MGEGKYSSNSTKLGGNQLWARGRNRPKAHNTQGPKARDKATRSRRPVWLGYQGHGEQYKYVGEAALKIHHP